MSKLAFRLLVAASLTVAISCSQDPATALADHLKRGDDYLAQKKLPEAIIEYRGAVQADAQSGEARRKLADAYMQSGDPSRALGEYVRTADLMPNDTDVQLKAGNLLLRAGSFLDARTRAERVLALQPTHLEGQLLRGQALAGLKDLDGAIAQVNAAIKSAPMSERAYSVLGSLQMARGDAVAAEAAFKQAIEKNPKSVEARLSLSTVYWATRRRPEAEKVLVEALAVAPKDLAVNQALTNIYLNTGRASQADATMKVLADSLPDPDGRLLMADYYVSVNRTVEGKALLEQLAKEPKAEVQAKLKLAALFASSGDRRGALGLLDEVLGKEPKQAEAILQKGTLQLDEGRQAEALATLRTAVEANPASGQAHYMVGRALVAGGQLQDATTAYQKALQADPKLGLASLGLARLSLQGENFDEAVEFARAAVEATSGEDSAEASLLLARALAAKGDTAAAERTLKTVTANFPGVAESAQVQTTMGLVLTVKGDAAGARAAFDRALRRDPSQVGALEGLTVLDLQRKQVDAARARWRTALAAAPNDAAIQFAAARAFAAMGDTVDAERLTKQVLAANANILEAYALLAQLYFQQHRLQEATAEFTRLADLQPKSAAPLTVVAMLMQLQNKVDAAQAGYEKALQIDPKAAVAANNLAQIYVDRNEKLDEALQLAQTAKAGLPTSHEVSDTLGWVYYKKDLATAAITALSDSVAAQKGNPTYHYHLGMAYLKAGQVDKGRASLREALRLKPDFPEADQARQALSGR